LARPDALAPGGRRFALSAAAAGAEAAEVTLFVVISVWAVFNTVCSKKKEALFPVTQNPNFDLDAN
jgi:hypothetical protein